MLDEVTAELRCSWREQNITHLSLHIDIIVFTLDRKQAEIAPWSVACWQNLQYNTA